MTTQVLEDELTDQELVRHFAYEYYWVRDYDRLGFLVLSKGKRQISMQFNMGVFEHAKLYINMEHNKLDDMADLDSLIKTMKV